ncbi:TetR/AcrR family transcriptional regulator [Rhodoplanes sp. Z2-YC6860]|uniref:TetR/AcrR family transcriptional regulator n=1 Tax=Rhodoplanes sp. Z2-YC6860 TaxID=674703 RepID=UPI00078D0394|nr:TetR/AcrR family transcriptional regulator [Rhodoplanes sp. Z2-YC6860]AMN40660.1 TetR family transcriptional regulator [Rhodoplanes sp. Z2-YC6860]
MVQVKKKQVRQAILDSAYDLFSERGYHSTTLQDVAELAGVGVSSLYSYFPSKLHLLYAVFEPWHKGAFEKLEKRILKLKSPRDRLFALLLGLWRDIPIANIGLTNSLMEALASADPAQPKPVPLLKWTEERLMRMLKAALPEVQVDHDALSTLFIMAYDGFVINRRLNDLRDIERLSNAMCNVLLGPAGKR